MLKLVSSTAFSMALAMISVTFSSSVSVKDEPMALLASVAALVATLVKFISYPWRLFGFMKALLIEHCTATPKLILTFNEITNLAHGLSRVDIKLGSLSYDEVH